MAAEYYQGEPIWIDPNQRYAWEKPDRALTQDRLTPLDDTAEWPYDGDPVDEIDDERS